MLTPFAYAAAFALLFAGIFLVRWIAARRRLMEDARHEWTERCDTKTATIKGVDKSTFIRIYVAAYEPRWAIYISATLLTAVIISLPASQLLMGLWPILVLGLDGGPWYDVGYYPWMFYMFFGMVLIWAFTGFVAARIHHGRRPEPFQAALARARGEPLEAVEIIKPRPKWAKRSRPDKIDMDYKPGQDETSGADAGNSDAEKI